MPTFLAIIPARSGSKGLPGKNKKILNGKPLISWTIEAAKKSKYITDIVVSSDDSDILKIAKQYGPNTPLQRPAILSSDTASSMEVILHVLEQKTNYDYMVLLQPTSPLRTEKHIDQMIEQMLRANKPLSVSVTEAEPSPYLIYEITDRGENIPLIPVPHPTRRQDYKKYYMLNGAIYIADTQLIQTTKTFLTNDTLLYKMPRKFSYDIDTLEDFLICEVLQQNQEC